MFTMRGCAGMLSLLKAWADKGVAKNLQITRQQQTNFSVLNGIFKGIVYSQDKVFYKYLVE